MSKRQSTLFFSMVAMAACFLVPLLIGQTRARKESRKSAAPPSAVAKPTATPAATPALLSMRPADIALAREIDRAIDTSDLTRARWGVFVTSMKDGRVLYSRNGEKLFTPASNMKIYTTAIAIDLLGADYHWRTSVYAGKQPDSNGVIDGDLTLFGRG